MPKPIADQPPPVSAYTVVVERPMINSTATTAAMASARARAPVVLDITLACPGREEIKISSSEEVIEISAALEEKTHKQDMKRLRHLICGYKHQGSSLACNQPHITTYLVSNLMQQQQRQTSTQVRKVILSLKEVVDNHSDADIYAALKESNMDPIETAQKLLNQDPFHEVKRKRDKKKELTGYVGFSDARRRMGYNLQSAKPHMTWDRNVQRRDYNRNTLPDAGSNREIRVVREYRVKENVKRDDNPGSVHNSASEEEQSKFNLQDISSIEVLADQKQSATRNSEGLMPSVRQPCDSVAGHTKGVVPTSTSLSLQLGKTRATASTLNSQTRREGQDSSKENSSLTLSNSVVGVYSSASDPVHVPSPASRPSGTVGAIRREVGVVGVRKQSSYQPATNSAVPNSSFSVPLSAKDISSTKESFEQSVGTPKQNQVVVSDPVISNGSTSRSFSGSQHNIKVAQQSSGHQKAMQSTMEWKPKTSQKPTVISPIVSAQTRSSCAEDASSSNPADVSNLSKKLSQVNVLEEPERHVIIPQLLQVPESEYTKLTFGSFAAGFDSTKSFFHLLVKHSKMKNCVMNLL